MAACMQTKSECVLLGCGLGWMLALSVVLAR